ncbi:MAG TPA: ABC-2 family transporter protein [Armatimonadota bacterium]|jgi:ABC-2 type transport system permease protein
MESLKLFWIFVKTSIQNDTEYRADFFTQLFVVALRAASQLGILWVVFSHTTSLGGWSRPQVLALLGVYNFMLGMVFIIIAPNMRQVLEDIRQGTLDFALLKPVDSQFLVSIRQFSVWRISDILMGLAMTLYATHEMAQTLTLREAVLFPLMLLSGGAIVYSLWLALTTAAFWFTRIDNIEMIFWNVFEAGRYPIDVYPLQVRRLLTYGIPLAFITSVPARALGGTLSPPMVVASLVLATAATLASAWFWRLGLRRYGSASS